MIRSVGDGDKTQYASDEESDTEDERTKVKVLPVLAKMRKGVAAIRNSPQRREALALDAKRCTNSVECNAYDDETRERFETTLRFDSNINSKTS